MRHEDIHKIVRILKEGTRKWDVPIVTLTAETYHDPFRVLISTLLSLRTQDTTTAKVSKRLFELADNPQDMLKLSVKEIEKVIYPIGFYKTKASTISYLCRELIDKYKSRVPDELEELLTLKGVGRKTV